MGAMLVGMATGFMMMGFVIVWKIVFAAALGIGAYRHKMKPVNWVIAGLLLDFWMLPVYIGVRVKIGKLKCPACGSKVGKNTNFCISCGEAIKRIDDGAIVKKFVLSVCLIMAAFIALGTVCSMIFT